MFSKILIANRGEIACRVMATARGLGIGTVAVYSEADRHARHVEEADEAYLLGPAPASESYLKGAAIIDVAKRSGAQAIHPGYGFLSENAAFAEACAAAGLVFIGPPTAAIRAMGLKDEAKRIMTNAGVPVVPGYHGEDQDPDVLAEQAAKIGYPILIKAVAGGGGKGMRRVDAAGDFAAALDGAKREAASAFGDDRVLLERYLAKPRHIEVQVFADSLGQAVHLFERDCSLQRRHQKILEEAPAPGMTEALRSIMGQAAVKAAQAIGYEGAGTVEFIAEASGDLDEKSFFFMEMNTRLQVEHPITEMVTGQDLVAWQLRVAAGGTLPLTQDQLFLSGHAVEVRVYAEDPDRGFLPTTGVISHLRLPTTSSSLRIDSGIRQGDLVTPHYDPMLAKLIVHAEDRATALSRAGAALARFEIGGCLTNLSFLKRLTEHPLVRAGDVDTGLVETHLHDLRDGEAVPEDALILACLHVLSAGHAKVSSEDPHSPWAQCPGWRLWGGARQYIHLQRSDRAFEVPAGFEAEGWLVMDLPDGRRRVKVIEQEEARLVIDLGDRILDANVTSGAGRVTVFLDGVVYRFDLTDQLLAEGAEEAGDNRVTAPLPGLISEVLVDLGDRVEAGQALLVLEAMKMSHTLTAPGDGMVTELHHDRGEQVQEGATLLVIGQAEDGT